MEHILGLVVHVLAKHIDDVTERILKRDGLDIHPHTVATKMIITVNARTDAGALEHINWLQARRGVVAVAIVSHHFDDADAMDEELAS
jgi:nitrate reductase NapAB chaperone NapD